MNYKFMIYAIVISLVSSIVSWQSFRGSNTGSAGHGGSSWSSSHEGYGGSTSSGGGHK